MALSYSKKLPTPAFIQVIDFFCGCGGMSYGIQQTRQTHIAFQILAGIDIDSKALETYAHNVGAPAIERDVRAIEKRPELLRELIPSFDPSANRPLLFVGCAPCQGFSAHRKKDHRDDPRNSLLMSFARICGHFRPDFVIMENVPEVLTGRFRSYFSEATDHLSSVGYRLQMDVLDFSLYGVPQRRRRAVLVGGLDADVSLPHPIFNKDTAPTVRQAIAHLFPIRSGEFDKHDPNHVAPNHTALILARIRKTPKDGGDRRSLKEADQLRCHASVDNGATPGFTDVYGRLRWDSPSVTITAKSSTPSCGRFLHPEQHRNITVREAALLQGFPHSFTFKGPLVHMYRQIGEAVPPLFARFLAWQILDVVKKPLRLPAKLRSMYRDRPKKPVSPGELQAPDVVDCFCGAGGLSLGFEAAGFNPAYAIDTDEDCITTFSTNISEAVSAMDVRSPDLPGIITDRLTAFDYVLAGGPPCQGFSQQRRGVDTDPRNNLVLCFADLALELPKRPSAIVLENVTYLDAPRGRRILKTYTKRLEEEGYHIVRHDMNSAGFAVPQLRKRIIIVALSDRLLKHYKPPKPLTPTRWRTIGETFTGLLVHAYTQDLFDSPLANNEPAKDGPANRRRIAFVDMGSGRLAIPPSLQLPCHTKYNGHLDVYGRLDWFSQARTITGGFDSFTRGEYGHPFLHRSITPREAARIQGFPDWFVFSGNRASLRRQIGNAVPPPLAFSVATAIWDAMKKAAGQQEEKCNG